MKLKRILCYKEPCSNIVNIKIIEAEYILVLSKDEAAQWLSRHPWYPGVEQIEAAIKRWLDSDQ